MSKKLPVPRGSDPINYYKSKIGIGQRFRVGPHKKQAIFSML